MIIAKNLCALRKSTSGGRIAELPVDAPVVEHAAELVDRAVEKRLLFRRQGRGRERQELRPVRIAGEQVGVPPDVAGLDRLALGVGKARQHVLRPPGRSVCGDPVPRNEKSLMGNRGSANGGI
jgi:hypothetical protein